MARPKPTKKYGFFTHCDIPIYTVVKRNKYLYAMYWYDLEEAWINWVHEESDLEDLMYSEHTVKLSFLEWIQHLKVSGVTKYPRYVFGYTNKQASRMDDIFAGDKLRRGDDELFSFPELTSVSELEGLTVVKGDD